jgi:hypothetical protein
VLGEAGLPNAGPMRVPERKNPSAVARSVWEIVSHVQMNAEGLSLNFTDVAVRKAWYKPQAYLSTQGEDGTVLTGL